MIYILIENDMDAICEYTVCFFQKNFDDITKTECIWIVFGLYTI